MRRLLAFVLLLGLLGATLRAQAGGVIPLGMGLYQDGRLIDTVPASASLIRWYYYGSTLTERAKDEVAFATASVDIETMAFRILYGGDAPTPVSIVAFSFKSNPTDDECLDDIAGNCTLAKTECAESVKDGNFRLCSVYRVSVYPNNIRVKAEEMGIAWEDRLYSIIRHEMGHVLGLTHDGSGPMSNGENQFTSCQLAKWEAFDITTATTWSRPDVCPVARLAQRVTPFTCPDME